MVLLDRKRPHTAYKRPNLTRQNFVKRIKKINSKIEKKRLTSEKKASIE
jgi:hypothetical protein